MPLLTVIPRLFVLIAGLFSITFVNSLYGQSANFTFTTPGDSCESRTVQFNASASTGTITSYAWQFVNKTTGANIGSGTGVNILKNFLSPGTYSVTLTVSGAGGSNSKTIDIKVYRKPVVNFSVDINEGCPPLAVVFHDLSTPGDGTIAKWEWNYNDGTKDIALTNTDRPHTYASSNEYSPTLIITNSFGCTNSLSKNKLIKVYNKVKPTFLVRNNYSCTIPHTVSFENTSPAGGPFNYEWDFGDGTIVIDNGAFVYHTYTAPGVFVVKLTARNLPGTCSDFMLTSGAQNVYVGRPTADFVLPATVCVGSSLSLGAAPDHTGISNNGVWIFDDNGAFTYGTSSYHTFNTAGTWTVKYKAFNTFSGCASDTIAHSIDVLPSPVADFTIDRPVGCQTPHTVTFTNTSTDAIRYEWNFGDGSPVVATTSSAPRSHAYNSFSGFTVRLTAYNASCSNSVTRSISNTRPAVDFDFSPAEGCKPLPVQIRTRTSTADPVDRYAYVFSDGTKDTTASPLHTHTFAAAGPQRIQVSIITRQGCTASSSIKNLSVEDICYSDGGGDPAGAGGAGGALEVERGVGGCSDKYTFAFRDTLSSATATLLSWDFDGVPGSSTANPITYTFPSNIGKKKFIVTATLRDNTLGTIIEHKIGVVVIDEKANYVLDKSDICKGLDIGFETVGIDSSKISKFIWDFGDSTARQVIDNKDYFLRNLRYLNGNTLHIYADTGRFKTKLIIEDILGCKDSISLATEITVKGPLAKFSMDDSTSCSKDFKIKLDDQSVGNGTVPIISRTWNFGDASAQIIAHSDSTVEHDYVNNSYYQRYNPQLTIVDALGCRDTYTKEINAYAPKANFQTSDVLRCNKFDIFFYNTSSALISNYNQFTWIFNDGTKDIDTLSRESNSNITYVFPSDTGHYSITLKIIDNGGCRDSLTKSGYVNIVHPVAMFDIGADTSKCVGTFSLPFISRSTYSTDFSWDFGDGETSSTNNIEVNHFYKRAGIYDVKLNVTGLDGCVDSLTQKVRIKGPDGELVIDDNFICLGEDFPAKVEGFNIKNFYWDFDDLSPTDSLITRDSVLHEYSMPGKYVPNVILLSPENCQITLNATDTVMVDKLDAGLPANIECGDVYTVIRANTALNIPGQYYWQGPAGATYLPDSSALEAQVDIPGIYRLSVKHDLCKQTDTVTVTTSGIVPTADAGANKKLDCIERNIVLQGSTTTADTHFKWSGPGGATFAPDSTVANPIVTMPGTYILTVRQKDCITTDEVDILPCSLDPTDTTLTLCANFPRSIASYRNYDLNELNALVVGRVPGTVSWYLDQRFTMAVAAPDDLIVENDKIYFARIVSLDGTETARAGVRAVVYGYVKAQIESDRDTICENDGPIVLSSRKWHNESLAYNWYRNEKTGTGISGNTSIRIKAPEESGLYYLKVASSYCPASWDSVNIKIYEYPRISFPTQSINVTYQDGNYIEMPLDVDLDDKNQISSIQWQPDSYLMAPVLETGALLPLSANSIVQRPFYMVQDRELTNHYIVKVTTGPTAIGCEAEASLIINNYMPVYIPNVFTPNSDGLNDTWVIRGMAKYPKTNVKVFDRWGKMIFEQLNGYNNHWDGTVKSDVVPFGTYYYVIDFAGSEDRSDYQTEGWLLITK